MIANPKPKPRTRKVRRWKTPRCAYGVGRCKRPAAMDGMCASHRKMQFDREWSAQVRAAGKCEAEGVAGVRCGGSLQAAHGFPRTYLKTRWVPLNGFCLCAGHHRWYTSHPLEWTAFMVERLGELPYEELRLMALGRVP